MSFLVLPPELREEIYGYIIGSEQEDCLEYVGNGGKRVKYEFCLPLRKVRPPVLIRVCKTIRLEYLPYFFKSTCFRIYVNIQSSEKIDKQAGGPSVIATPLFQLLRFQSTSNWVILPAPSTWQSSECTVLETPAKNWLDSLRSRDGVRFRQVQIRLVNCEGRPVGFNFNTTFNARELMYEIDFKRDQLWDVIERLFATNLIFNVVVGPGQVLKRLRELCEFAKDEVLDWKTLEYLVDEFNISPYLDPRSVPFGRLKDWNEEVRLLA